MSIDYTRGEIDVVIDLIRRQHQGKPLTSGQVTFGDPGVFTPIPGFERDTVVVASSIPGRGFEGNQPFYYNRVKVGDFIPPNAPEILYFQESGLTLLSQLLPEINERLKTNITPDKMVERNLPIFAAGDDRSYAEVALSLKPHSLVYTGQTQIRIVRNAVPLAVAIPDPVMDGLTYEPPVE